MMLEFSAVRGRLVENRTFDEISVGDSATHSRTITEADSELFAMISGEMAAVRVQSETPGSNFATHMLGLSLVSDVLATELPGPGTTYLSQEIKVYALIELGDKISTTVTVREKKPDGNRVVIDCVCTKQNGETVLASRVEVRAPVQKISRSLDELPDIRLGRHLRFRDLLAHAAKGAPVSLAVVHPCDALSLGAVIEMARAALVTPILVGPKAKINSVAALAGFDISAFRLVDAPHSHAAAAQAVALVRAGEAEVLMKGALHTDELMHEVVAHDTGLRTERRMSHVYLMDVPSYPRPLLITDAALNIDPDLIDKRDIIQNAIDLAHIIGIETPRVAILSAVETISPALRSTLDAAALCKMADRGQIVGGLVDGPLAFDNAINIDAAREKGIISPVAGLADIVVVPNLEAGNMLAKQLSFLAGADAAGVVVGASVPIILTSRADSERTRIASCAVAVLMARSRRAPPSAT